MCDVTKIHTGTIAAMVLVADPLLIDYIDNIITLFYGMERSSEQKQARLYCCTTVLL